MSGGKRGKLFFRKVFPVPLSKDFKQEIGIWLPRGFTVAEVCAGFVRSPIVDPDLRSPSGFDFGLRPSLRMTRRVGTVGCWVVVHGTFSVSKCLIGMSNCLKKRVYTY